jgi:hypothetical protein
MVPDRPTGCGGVCSPDMCRPCGAAPNRVACVGHRCATLYEGECQPCCDQPRTACPPDATCCPDGQVCELADDGAHCVADPSECNPTEGCPGRPEGYECRDWLSDGVLFCWHPESTCFGHINCFVHSFCEDPDGTGIYHCVDGGPDCRVVMGNLECQAGNRCDDPDGDGRGTCVPE